MLTSVVFPDPFGPKSPTGSPGATDRATPERILVAPNAFVIPSADSSVFTVCPPGGRTAG